MRGEEVYPRVLISYTHDSEEHKQRVLALSNRLREEGVDCHVDQYIDFPPQGWPRWMIHEIDWAQYVLVVCTETYQRRALGYEEPGRGLGATWEGLVITQELYESGARNTKFVPVIFSSNDAQHIPVYLRGATHYNPSTDDGYERLYALLTNQPRVVPPALGQRREIQRTNAPSEHPVAGSVEQPVLARAAPDHDRTVVLLHPENSDVTYFLPAERIDEGESHSTLVLVPESPRESAGIESLRGAHKPEVMVAHDVTAYRGAIRSVVRSRHDRQERWTIEVEPSKNKWDVFTSEVTYNGVSPDEIATMRARRILLNERPSEGGTSRDRMNDIMMEHYIAGEQYGMSITGSPFPELYGKFGGDTTAYLEAARLSAVLLLRLTNVVAHVFRLELEITGRDRLAVAFEGQRRQVYSNVPATVIRVEGICDLQPRS